MYVTYGCMGVCMECIQVYIECNVCMYACMYVDIYVCNVFMYVMYVMHVMHVMYVWI